MREKANIEYRVLMRRALNQDEGGLEGGPRFAALQGCLGAGEGTVTTVVPSAVTSAVRSAVTSAVATVMPSV